MDEKQGNCFFSILSDSLFTISHAYSFFSSLLITDSNFFVDSVS